jgi:hypothetical protein
MAEPANNLLTATRGMEILKSKISKLGGRCLQESRPNNRLILDIETPAKLRVQLRVKSMSRGGWQGTINDGKPDPLADNTKFWVLIDLGQPAGHERFYIVPEHLMQKDIFEKHEEYLANNNGERVNSPNSKHHAIKVERVKKWESKWDLLGF